MFNEKYLIENIRHTLMSVKDRVYSKVCDITLEAYRTKEPVSFENRKQGEYLKLVPGDKWGELFDCAWFHCTAKVPESAEGKKLVYVIDINGEGLIYDDEGCPIRGITNVNSTFDRAMGNPGKRIVQYRESAAGGETVDSLIFFPIAFFGLEVKELLYLMVTQVVLKTLYEIIILPVTSLVVRKLKRFEGIDTFDNRISYNPFRIFDI